MYKSIILGFLLSTLNLHAFELETFKGVDINTGEECSLTLTDRRWAETSYIDDITFVLRRFNGGAPTGGCDREYFYCLFGPPIDDQGNILDEVEFDLFIAFSDNDEPLYFLLENAGFNSTLDKKCRLN